MTNLLIQDIEKKFIKNIPVIRPGYSVRISQKIREGEKERVQIFEGLVLGFNGGRGSSKMIKVRKMVEGIGVEKTFPLYSPIITKIVVTKTPKVRRAKLFYMRDLAGKATRLRSRIGIGVKDAKYSKRQAELLEAMGLDKEAPAANAAQMEMVMEAPAPETTAPETQTQTEKKE